MKTYKIDIDPMAKPRMTRADKWQKRDCVMRYRVFADELRLKVKTSGFKPREILTVRFGIKMPDSWSLGKCATFEEQPHQSKPDIDNLVKAIMDTLYKTDQHIHTLFACKRWALRGSIEFMVDDKIDESLRHD